MKTFDNSEARLFLIPTPIGNLGDITMRAAKFLSDLDVIFCEDTRRTMILLKSLGISRKLQSLHSYNLSRRILTVIRMLKKGLRVGYICDSGTPGISDPGTAVLQAARDAGFAVSVLPGPTALIPAVVMSALPSDKFLYLGFAPASPTKRRRLLRKIENIPFTIIFYESPHRIQRMLADCVKVLGDRECALIREISKIHEEVILGNISEVMEHFEKEQPRGEMVLVVAGKSDQKPNNKN